MGTFSEVPIFAAQAVDTLPTSKSRGESPGFSVQKSTLQAEPNVVYMYTIIRRHINA